MNLRTDVIIYFIRIFIMNLYVYFSFMKIISRNINSFRKMIMVLIINILVSAIGSYIEFFINSFLAIIVMFLLYGISLGSITKNRIGYSLVVILIAYAICETCSAVSTILAFIPYNLIGIQNQYWNLCIILGLQSIMIYGFFKIRKLKNGFDFIKNKLNNDYTEIIIINISAVIMLMYCLVGTMYDELTINLLCALVIFGVTMFAVIQKTFVMYYKQKLLNDTIKQYEKDLQEKNKEIEKLSNEKYEISRINHEFYNRQKSLELKVREFTEISDEIGILDRIENLTKEYSEQLQKIKGKDKLPLTNIPEIDDMFRYMQTECDKYKIDFKLKIESEIYYLVNNIIPINKLETLIGDHLRNAIIAINSSNSENKGILTIFGIKDKCYELCIYDTGIEFKIETLLKLGKERATTHKETGGSGIGFMTTFETLKECKASLVIEEKHEMLENDYTKAIKIRFDGKSEYRIVSYRADKIKKMCNDSKIIIKEQ